MGSEMCIRDRKKSSHTMNEPEAMAGSTYQGALLTSELQESVASPCMLLDDAGVITPQPWRWLCSLSQPIYISSADFILSSVLPLFFARSERIY